ncbi:hypothetical protein SCANM63S_05511 [Streptomyces canarius]
MSPRRASSGDSSEAEGAHLLIGVAGTRFRCVSVNPISPRGKIRQAARKVPVNPMRMGWVASWKTVSPGCTCVSRYPWLTTALPSNSDMTIRQPSWRDSAGCAGRRIHTGPPSTVTTCTGPSRDVRILPAAADRNGGFGTRERAGQGVGPVSRSPVLGHRVGGVVNGDRLLALARCDCV